MVRLNLLQIFSLLDLYAALLLALSATVYRLQHGKTEPEALSFSAMLVALALSTCAQCQFGLDSGLSRYHLFPIRGWQVLFAKDVAFLIVLVVLVLPLSLGPGLAFGLIAIAVGRYPSLILRPAQSRWRFTGGDLRFGVLQAVAGTAFGFAEYQHGPYFLLVASVLYLLSLFLGGRYWDRTEKL